MPSKVVMLVELVALQLPRVAVTFSLKPAAGQGVVAFRALQLALT